MDLAYSSIDGCGAPSHGVSRPAVWPPRLFSTILDPGIVQWSNFTCQDETLNNGVWPAMGSVLSAQGSLTGRSHLHVVFEVRFQHIHDHQLVTMLLLLSSIPTQSPNRSSGSASITIDQHLRLSLAEVNPGIPSPQICLCFFYPLRLTPKRPRWPHKAPSGPPSRRSTLDTCSPSPARSRSSPKQLPNLICLTTSHHGVRFYFILFTSTIVRR